MQYPGLDEPIDEDRAKPAQRCGWSEVVDSLDQKLESQRSEDDVRDEGRWKLGPLNPAPPLGILAGRMMRTKFWAGLWR